MKASDLRMVFPQAAQAGVYFHSGAKRNQKLRSLGSRKLKSAARLCEKCNTARTQAHDRAWELMSKHLQTNSGKIKRTGKFDLGSVFPGASRKEFGNVALYFTKLFGCIAIEHNVPLPVAEFAQSILHGVAPEFIQLAFGVEQPLRPRYAAVSPVSAWRNDMTGEIEFAYWSYKLNCISITVIYSRRPVLRNVIQNSYCQNEVAKIVKLSTGQPRIPPGWTVEG
jgi:hypothetical protein